MASHTSDNPHEFLLPDLGEGLVEAELVEWCVQPGQKVQEHETIARMETAKALVEVPADRTGVIEHLHGNPGDTIEVGSPLVTYQDPAGPKHGDNGAAPASD